MVELPQDTNSPSGNPMILMKMIANLLNPAVAVDSVLVFGSVSGPTAGAVIVSVPAARLGAGIYEVLIGLTLSGTVAALDGNNLALSHGPTQVVTLLLPVAGNAAVFLRIPRITILAGESIVVAAIGAGTATATYSAIVVATRAG